MVKRAANVPQPGCAGMSSCGFVRRIRQPVVYECMASPIVGAESRPATAEASAAVWARASFAPASRAAAERSRAAAQKERVGFQVAQTFKKNHAEGAATWRSRLAAVWRGRRPFFWPRQDALKNWRHRLP
jgi:hypothetical protein